MKTQLDKEEKQLLESVEHGEWASIRGKGEEFSKYKISAQKTLNKVHNIKVDIPENDFIMLKRKSLDTGISTEMLVRSLIHNYTTGKVTLCV